MLPAAPVRHDAVVAAAVAVVDRVAADEQAAAAGVAAVEACVRPLTVSPATRPETTPGVTADAVPPS
jgi:hypothetical protein